MALIFHQHLEKLAGGTPVRNVTFQGASTMSAGANCLIVITPPSS